MLGVPGLGLFLGHFKKNDSFSSNLGFISCTNKKKKVVETECSTAKWYVKADILEICRKKKKYPDWHRKVDFKNTFFK